MTKLKLPRPRIIWDYQIPRNWKPRDEQGWLWYLTRKINYDDWAGLDPKIIRPYLKRLKIDTGKRLMLEAYFRRYGKKKNR